MDNIIKYLDKISTIISEGGEHDPKDFAVVSKDKSELVLIKSLQKLLDTIEMRHQKVKVALEKINLDRTIRSEAVLDTMLDALIVISDRGIIQAKEKLLA